MNEEQWLSYTDPTAILEFLRGNKTSLEILESPQGRDYDRKARLFSVVCCRRLWPLLVDEWLREAVLTAERHADGKVTDAEMGAAVKAVHRFNHTPLGRAVYETAQFHPGAAIFRAGAVALTTAQGVSWYHIRLVPPTTTPYLLGEPPIGAKPPRSRPRGQQAKAKAAERAAQCVLLRDIFGPTPFQPVSVSPSLLVWHGGTVVRLAQVIYEERRFEDLPILADALEEAGCSDQKILSHCRQQGQVHVRGCWVVDLLLNKG
jgi:hypothetical protein